MPTGVSERGKRLRLTPLLANQLPFPPHNLCCPPPLRQGSPGLPSCTQPRAYHPGAFTTRCHLSGAREPTRCEKRLSHCQPPITPAEGSRSHSRAQGRDSCYKHLATHEGDRPPNTHSSKAGRGPAGFFPHARGLNWRPWAHSDPLLPVLSSKPRDTGPYNAIFIEPLPKDASWSPHTHISNPPHPSCSSEETSS